MLEDRAVDVTALAMYVPHLTHKQRGFSQRPHMTSSPGELVRLQLFTQLHERGTGKMLPSDTRLRRLLLSLFFTKPRQETTEQSRVKALIHKPNSGAAVI